MCLIDSTSLLVWVSRVTFSPNRMYAGVVNAGSISRSPRVLIKRGAQIHGRLKSVALGISVSSCTVTKVFCCILLVQHGCAYPLNTRLSNGRRSNSCMTEQVGHFILR